MAILVHPWPTRQPPRPTRPTTMAHAPISYQWSMAGPSSALPPSPPATPQSSPVSSVTGHSTEPNPPDILGGRLSDPTPRGPKGQRLTVERAALACCPTRTPRSPFRTGVVRGAPSHTDLLGSVLTAPHTSITTRRAACRGPSPALEGVETGPTASAVMNGGE